MAHRTHGLAFHSAAGRSGRGEHFITVEAPGDLPVAGQLDVLAHRYAEALQTLNLAPETAVFRRLYLSDAANQAKLAAQSSLAREPLDSQVAVSMVQQAPLPDGKVAMLAYHLDGMTSAAKREVAPGHMLARIGDLEHLWSTRLCARDTGGPSEAAAQTRAVFANLTDVLAAHGASLADQCVRTWIYVKDVDVFYQDMVDARVELFAREGLTRETHFLASTGIEGSCSHRYDVVLMDAYSVLGLRPEQVSYLNDFDHLCSTADYGVTFERGTRVAYADRAHHFVSGTASIDASGKVVHRGDVGRQFTRALENVDALLHSGGASLDDMTHLVVYLRDPSDRNRIEAMAAERFGDLPRLVLRGAVCRPEWLVEVEGIAVAPHEAPGLPSY